MGRNGVGKTTLLNAVDGRCCPARSGAVLLDGEDITKLPRYKRARPGIGYVPQGHQVFPQLTVAENLSVVHERVRAVTAPPSTRRSTCSRALHEAARPPGRPPVAAGRRSSWPSPGRS